PVSPPCGTTGIACAWQMRRMAETSAVLRGYATAMGPAAAATVIPQSPRCADGTWSPASPPPAPIAARNASIAVASFTRGVPSRLVAPAEPDNAATQPHREEAMSRFVLPATDL